MIAFLDLLDTDYEKEQFAELYQQYANLLYKIALGKLHNTHDAEECVQEAFFYVAKNFYKIKDIHSASTKCYLSTIVSGIAINRFNRNKTIEFLSLDDNMEYNDLSYIQDYDKNEISFYIDKLDDISKNIIYLTYFFGYKAKEIAVIYNISTDTVKKRLSRALKKLNELI